MINIKGTLTQIDDWASDLSRIHYATTLGVVAGFSALIVGLLVQQELNLAQSLGMGVGMFAFEALFGIIQPSED